MLYEVITMETRYTDLMVHIARSRFAAIRHARSGSAAANTGMPDSGVPDNRSADTPAPALNVLRQRSALSVSPPARALSVGPTRKMLLDRNEAYQRQ